MSVESLLMVLGFLLAGVIAVGVFAITVGATLLLIPAIVLCLAVIYAIVIVFEELRLKGYILIHEGKPLANVPFETVAFDIVTKKKYTKMFRDILKEALYTVNCKYVEEFLRKNPEFEYIGSEDLLHTLEYNASNIELICSLVQHGFKIKVVRGEESG